MLKRKKNSFKELGLTDERYKQLSLLRSDTEILDMINLWGVVSVNRGYSTLITYDDDCSIGEAVSICSLTEVGVFEDDFEACRQAERDGFHFINDIDGLEKGRYLDTAQNRCICQEVISKCEICRIENWIDTSSLFAKKYFNYVGSLR